MLEAVPPDNAIVAIEVPEQMVWAEFVATTFGVGLTRTVVVIGIPLQPFATGVMVKVTVIAVFVVLLKLPLTLPLPLAAIPVAIAVLFLIQLKVVAATLPERAIALIAVPEQMVWVKFVDIAFGVGFTRTVVVI